MHLQGANFPASSGPIWLLGEKYELSPDPSHQLENEKVPHLSSVAQAEPIRSNIILVLYVRFSILRWAREMHAEPCL